MIGVKYWFIHWEGGNCIFSIQNKHALKSRHHLTCFKFTSYFIFFVVVCAWTTSEHMLCSSCTKNITSSAPTSVPWDWILPLRLPPVLASNLRASSYPSLIPLHFSEDRPMLKWSDAAASQALAFPSCPFMSWLDFVLHCSPCKVWVGREHVFICVP